MLDQLRLEELRRLGGGIPDDRDALLRQAFARLLAVQRELRFLVVLGAWLCDRPARSARSRRRALYFGSPSSARVGTSGR